MFTSDSTRKSACQTVRFGLIPIFLWATLAGMTNCAYTPEDFFNEVPPLMATGPGGMKGDKIVLGTDGCASVTENSGIKVSRLVDGRIELVYAHSRAKKTWIVESVELRREEHLEHLLKMKNPDGEIERALAILSKDENVYVWSMPDEQHTVYRPVKCFRLKNGNPL